MEILTKLYCEYIEYYVIAVRDITEFIVIAYSTKQVRHIRFLLEKGRK